MEKSFLAFALAVIATSAIAEPPYAVQGGSTIWKNGFGQCWRSGTWSTEQGVYPCDGNPPAAPTPRAAEPQPAPVVQAPPPPVVQAPAPQPAPAPQKERVTLSADVLFDSGSATLKEGGRKQLDQLAGRLRSAEEITIVGHADRMGSAQYNQRLSEQRAVAVKQYLEKSTSPQMIRTAGKGSLEPVTGEACKRAMPHRKLVDCLQPDRRVDLEIYGPRSLAGTEQSPSSGAPAPRRVSDR